MKRIFLTVLLVACHANEPWTPANERDTRDDPAAIRPGYGDDKIHAWWPVSEVEMVAVNGIAQAKQGDMHALLALGLVASGDHKPGTALLEFEQRVDKFVADLKPAVDAADEWHKGYEINRAMHKIFFREDKSDLQNYGLDVARLTDVFTTGKYNCISSAVLYTILARGFDLPVRGVVMPEHAFAELGAKGGKIIEVETTSATGYDWVHDDRFYKEGAKDWSSKRGLRPTTLDDYNQRRVIEPATLMAQALIDSRAGDSDADRAHLRELAALVAPEDPDVQKVALSAYITEANELQEKKATRTMVKMFDVIAPTLDAIGSKAKDREVLEGIVWMKYYRAQALLTVKRSDEAIAIIDDGLKSLDPSWKDGAKLRSVLAYLISDHLLELMHAKDYEKAVKFISPRFAVCKAEETCAHNVSVIYQQQAIDHEKNGDWPAAKRGLQECIQLLPKVSGCAELLSDLEARH